MQIIQCQYESDAAQILEIFYHAILHTTALYEYKPRTMATMQQWFANKTTGNFPVIGLKADDGTLLAFGSYGTFRAFPAFKYSVEHSVYVHPAHQGKGYERFLAPGPAEGERVTLKFSAPLRQVPPAAPIHLSHDPPAYLRHLTFLICEQSSCREEATRPHPSKRCAVPIPRRIFAVIPNN